ncbi:glycosyltransferase family 2 protein [Gluconacetobacter tumulisoli]|uniref:Glycosyltransferase family 2 protein n=1 Tax=Gluconacetobacter tumulisoli TaxID=1286189 RepID=A0A7W4PLK7_9PROT|nr:glycosyltransferase family 2 protein [Gluconacetobacter tumulisoli]MBB2200739.1 glycosyltransferase family 2 protein [Gluconacetobacter tumulisoli]
MVDTLLVHVLKDAHGGLLAADPATGRLHTAPGMVPVLLVRHPARPDLGFLMAAGAAPALACDADDALPRALLSYRLVPAGQGRVGLRHPMWEHYVCALPPDQNAPARCDRPRLGGWEQFAIEPPPAGTAGPDAALAAAIHAVVSGGMGAMALRGWCRAAAAGVQARALVAFLRLLPRDEMERFAGIVLNEPAMLARLRRAVPDDYWIRAVLPDLVSWRAHRRPLAHRRLDGDTDFLGRADYGEHGPPPLGFALLGQARRLVAPRRRACVLATARDEAIYLLEWVAWHRMIGFDHIFICSNNNVDGSDALLAALARHGLITWIDTNPQSATRIQRKAYAAALSAVPQMLDYRWTLVIDLDEMLALDPDRYTHIGPFLDLQEARGADAVAFSWVMMTPGGLLHHDDAPMTARFQRREPPENALVKSATQTRLSPFAHAHNPHWAAQRSFRTLDASGALLHTEASPSVAVGRLSEENAWIAHHFYKSFEEFVWKSSRPRGGNSDPRPTRQFTARFLDAFVRFFDSDQALPETRLLPFLPALEAEMARLRAIPDIRAAEADARALFRDRIRDLVRQSRDVVRDAPYAPHVRAGWDELLERYGA